ncbi:tyrosine-type recombinase/integrase, partial [Thermodesulfobacteriota bacterium]
GGILIMSEKAKVYPKEGDGPFRIWLSWKGKRYSRGYYDHRINLVHRDLADRLCGSINQDIDEKGIDFDPRDWFSSDKELQFSYAVDEWYKKKDYAPGTVYNVERAINLAKEFFGDKNIKDIRKAHLTKFLDTLTQAPTTKQSMMGFIKSALNEICDDWHLMRIPFPKISIPYKETKWITREEQDNMIKNIKERDKPIFLLMQAYGCRPSEACALMWDAIDFKNKVIIFKRTFSGERHLRDTTKTGYYRKNPLTEKIIEILKPLRMDIRNQFVFKNLLGNHYQRTPLWNIWKRAIIKAGEEHISLKNAFRHSKITQLEMAGHDYKMISFFIGHKKVQTTEGYMGVNLDNLKCMVG